MERKLHILKDEKTGKSINIHYFVGEAGCGKTTAIKKLSNENGWPLVSELSSKEAVFRRFEDGDNICVDAEMIGGY